MAKYKVTLEIEVDSENEIKAVEDFFFRAELQDGSCPRPTVIKIEEKPLG